MKKLLVLFGVLVFVPSLSYAYINESETSDIDVLCAQGYSVSTLQVVDTARYHNSGKNSKNKRYFRLKDNNKFGRAYTFVKNYLDPIQDDGRFGEHEINYTNTWSGEYTNYSTGREPIQEIDNL